MKFEIESARNYDEIERPLPSTSANPSENDRIENKIAKMWVSKLDEFCGLPPT